MSDHFERLYTIGLTSKITLFKFSWIVSTNFFFILQIGFQKIEGNWWIHYSQYLSIKLSTFILKTVVDLVILNCFTISMKFSFSLNFLKNLPCWYVMWTIFFFFVQIFLHIITAEVSLDFSIWLNFLTINPWVEQLLFNFIFARPFLLGSITSLFATMTKNSH